MTATQTRPSDPGGAETQGRPGQRARRGARAGRFLRFLVPPEIRRRRERQAAAEQAQERRPAGRRVADRTGPAVTSVAGSQAVVRELGLRRSRWSTWLGWDGISEPTVLSSTRQAEAVNPLVVATHPPLAGPPDGTDVQTRNAMSLDAHLLYEAKRITSPHCAVLGALGSGKTSYVMTAKVVRQVAMGRQVAVFDRKTIQEDGAAGAGEYADAAELCGGTIIEFRADGQGASLNLLDPRIAVSSDSHSGIVGQAALLELAAEYAHGPLNSNERAALSAAHRAAVANAKAEQDRVANIRDVIEALYDAQSDAIPHPALERRNLVSADDVVMWGLDLANDLKRFVEGDLAGLIDGDTSEEIDWSSPLLVFDTSEIPEGSKALSLVMMLVSTFLTNVWAARPRQRVLVLEEGYHAKNLAGAGGMTVAGLLKSLVKRGRGIGLSFVIVIHHISDIPRDSDAIALIQEAGMIHVYNQDKTDDIADVVNTYGFPPEAAMHLRGLVQGCQVVRVGSEAPRLMTHSRSKLEVALTDSDSAMEGRAKRTRTAVDDGGPGALR